MLQLSSRTAGLFSKKAFSLRLPARRSAIFSSTISEISYSPISRNVNNYQGVYALSTLSSSSSFHSKQESNAGRLISNMMLLGLSSILYSSLNSTTQQEALTKEDVNMSPASESTEDEEESLPIYNLKQVALRNGKNAVTNHQIWMTYGGYVYDVTDFISNHPGGAEHILQASGSSIEPFWNLYRQHFASDLPMQYLEKMKIGVLDEKDQELIDDQIEKTFEENDPYKDEPIRHPALKVHGDQPMNAEVPKELLTEQYITPVELFYIRHHHPVPNLSTEEIQNYRLEINLSAMNLPSIYLSLDEIKALPKHEIIATLQCSGNRRSNFNPVSKTSGTPWDQGAISTAKFAGPKLRDVLKHAGFDEDLAYQLELEHVRFESLDGMKASIGIEKAFNPYGDCIVAYEMNGEPLPRDHGYPIRAIAPGYCAVRNVKWVKTIEISREEAEGAWQRGLNYKVLPSNVKNAKSVDLTKMPSLAEASLFSGITKLEQPNKSNKKQFQTGDIVKVKASGWGWAGGGRNVVRINITGDGGKTWKPAEITMGGDQKFNRAWAWVFWTCEDIAAIVDEDGQVEICSKAVDAALNSQPEKCDHMWNIRGLGNNSWFRSKMAVN